MSAFKVNEVFSREERTELTRRSDWRGAWEVFFSWAMIAGVLAVTAVWPNPLTILLALILLGGRQLGLAVLMHEAAHYTLFKSRGLNDFVGKWLAGGPVLEDVHEYRPYHFKHHKHTGVRAGEHKDPDLFLVRFYPLTRKGLRKWMLNDLIGRVGFNVYRARMATKLGYLKPGPRGRLVKGDQHKKSIARQLADVWRAYHASFIVHGLLIAIFTLVGAPWLYLIWMAAQLTTFHFFMRVRVIAEHAMTEKSEDIFLNTRTTRAAWWERLLFAPHYVNFHLEHHLMTAVPCYRLGKMHRMLMERGALEKSPIAGGYREIIKMAAAA